MGESSIQLTWLELTIPVSQEISIKQYFQCFWTSEWNTSLEPKAYESVLKKDTIDKQ